MKQVISPLFQVGIFAIGYLFATSSATLAQVTSDGTVNTQVNQNGSIAEITGGETRGSNLFHSFQDFSVPTGNETFFNNADSISNIFSRVTGGNISNIDGAIRANGSASLFLINPAGIIFGENARLDIGGSFYGSSASSILFENGNYSTLNNLNNPILTINAPIGLGFRNNPADIINMSLANDGKGLEVEVGNNMSLWGGNITLNGGRITVPAGRIELGGLTEAGNIDLKVDGSSILAESVEKGNVSLTDSALVSVTGDIGGRIIIDADNLDLSANSHIRGGIASNANSLGVTSGNIILNIVEAINLDRSRIENLVAPESSGNAGNITITTDLLSLNNGSVISAETFGMGNAGSIFIDASRIAIDGGVMESAIASTINPQAEGMGGNITIATKDLELINNGLISTTTFGLGDAGNININADVIAIANNSLITSNVASLETGNAGNLSLETGSLSISDNSLISAETFGLGNAGSIGLAATQEVNITGKSRFTSNVGVEAIGNAGNLTIDADVLFLHDNSSVSAETFGMGNAGNIEMIIDRDLVIDTNSVIASTINREAAGMAGDITISSKNLILTNSALISNTTFGIGDAGSVLLKVRDNIAISNNSQVSSAVALQAIGNAGNLNVEANSINLDNNATIGAFVFSGEGGIVNLKVGENLTLRNNSRVSAEALNDSNGGNINIDAKFIIAFPDGNNDILASAQQGQGGNININAESLFGIQQRAETSSTNDINASSDFSLDGNVTITTPDINPVQGATELPTNVVEPEETSQQTCEANRESAAKNGLNITGKGGILPEPGLPLNSLNVTVNGENNLTSTIPAPIETAQGKIQPARGVIVTESGEVILTAYRISNSSDRIPGGSVNCGRV